MVPIALRLLPTADTEIEEQEAYYRDSAGDALALRWYRSVNATLRRLRVHPSLGSPVTFDAPALRTLRYLPVDDFPKQLIFYGFDPAANEILVFSVLHGSRDLEALLLRDIRQ